MENALSLLAEPTGESLYKCIDVVSDRITAAQELVKNTPTKTPLFRELLTWLLLSTMLYVRCIYDWFDENKVPMQFAAWAARNLFELEIWTRYVLKSRAYAERFSKDWVMDGIGIIEGMEAWSKLAKNSATVHPTLQKLIEMRDKELPGCKRFLDAREFIGELGMAEEYKYLNPVFSKLVHPTSWSVQWRQELLDKTHMRFFIITLGLTFAIRIVTAIEEHIQKHGLEAL